VRALLFALLVGCVDATAPVRPGDDAPRILEVPSGASASGLAARLAAEGLVPSEFAWKWYLRSTDGGCLKAGRHEVRGSMSMAQLLEALCGVPIPDDEPFTIVEGSRMRDVDEALATKGWIQPGAYLKAAETKAVPAPFEVTGPTYEGYLFPDTYRIEPKRFTAEELIDRQLKAFHERFVKPNEAAFGARSLHELVVMASMLEREEPTPSQQPIVAGILYKRLAAGWNLGVDATSRYRLDQWNDRQAFLVKLRDPEDPYNTRLRGGLPPTAIGNPGIESLEAALKPLESEFWYYLHDGEGKFHGGKSAAEHEANRARFNVY
jgi:UPF0755 protein